MANNLDQVIADVDSNINVGNAFLVGCPEAFTIYKLDNERSLNVIVQNIRSINKNFEDFTVFLARMT